MSLIACGISHKTSPLSIREKAALLFSQIPTVLQELVTYGSVDEVMILSTCNRTEIYTHTLALSHFTNWLTSHPQIGPVAESKAWYWYQDQQAVAHVIRVASGLDSMILGEHQILKQVKQAFQLAKQMGTVGIQLQRLLQKAFSVTKQIRTHTAMGRHPLSVAYAAVDLAKSIFSDLSKKQVLLVGAGQTIELVALHLADCGVKQFLFANRSVSKTERLAGQFNGHSISLEDIPLYLQNSHIVITATSSPEPIFNKTMVENVLKIGKRRPLLMIDLAVPRDIAPQVAQLEDVYLYNLDHLQDRVNENLKSRLDAVQQAEALIEIQARYYMRQLGAQDVNQLIQSYRTKLQQLRDQALDKAIFKLNQGTAAHVVLTEMANSLTNQILHDPCVKLREAGLNNQTAVLTAATQLLNLPRFN